MNDLQYFMSGASCLGFMISGLLFLKFWIRSHDRFFATFSLSFFMMAIERMLVLEFTPAQEIHSYVYLIRLLGFVFIIAAIIEKNRAQVEPPVQQTRRTEIAKAIPH